MFIVLFVRNTENIIINISFIINITVQKILEAIEILLVLEKYGKYEFNGEKSTYQEL